MAHFLPVLAMVCAVVAILGSSLSAQAGGDHGGHAGAAQRNSNKGPACIRSIVAFGDSLSDTGCPYGFFCLFGKTFSLKLLGYDGRFTNGQVWCEILSQRHNLKLVSFALGVTTVTTFPTTPLLSSQVDKYMAYIKTNKLETPYMCAVQAGNNDFLRLALGNPLWHPEILARIVSGIEASVGRLLANGCSSVAIANLSPLEHSPYFRLEESVRHFDLLDSLGAAIDNVNAGISKVVDQLSSAGHSVVLLDLHNLIHDIAAHPGSYNLQNSNDPCIKPPGNMGPDTYQPLDAENPAWLPTCKDPRQYFFWDLLHPTTHGHEIAADLVTSVMRRHNLLC